MRQRLEKTGNPKRITILLGAAMACGIATLLQHSLADDSLQKTASDARLGQSYNVSPQPQNDLGDRADAGTLPLDARRRQPAQPSFSAPQSGTAARAGTNGVDFVNSQTDLPQATRAIPTTISDGTNGSRIKIIQRASHEESAANLATDDTGGSSTVRLLTFEPQTTADAKPVERTGSLLFEAPPLKPLDSAKEKPEAPSKTASEPVTKPSTTTNSDSRFADLYKRLSPSSQAAANTPSAETRPAANSASRFADLYRQNPPASQTTGNTPTAASTPTPTPLELPPPPTTSPSGDKTKAEKIDFAAGSESADNVFAPPKIVVPPLRIKVVDKPAAEPTAAETTPAAVTPPATSPSQDKPAVPPLPESVQLSTQAAPSGTTANVATQAAPTTAKVATQAAPTDTVESSLPQTPVVPPAAVVDSRTNGESSNLGQESAAIIVTDSSQTSAAFRRSSALPRSAPIDKAEMPQTSLGFRARGAQSSLAAIDQLYKRGLVPFEPIAQLQPGVRRDPFLTDPDEPDPHAPAPFEILGPTGEMNVTVRRNKILRCKDNLTRVAVVDDRVVEFVQFSPREVSIIGREVGSTHVTFWFSDEEQRPITYLVRVTPDPELQNETEHEYQILEEVLAELFPDSKVYLIPVADKLIVRGQAKDAEEAAQILGILRGEETEFGGGRRGRLIGGNAAAPIPGGNARTVRSVVNMLQIPGVHQIALRVKIAELNRSAARNSGLNLDANIRFNGGQDGQLLLNTLLNSSTTASVFGTFTDFDIDLGLNYLKSQGVIRVLSEPTLVTMNGKSANFHAGGQFAVPTAVGVGGIGAVATQFKLFGVSLTFLPTILDKDRIRLNISPSFSQVDAGLSVGGTPGITDRSVSTTVEMREGQTLAIAGLLEDTMRSATAVDLPFLPRVFGKRDVSREETELIILVTPELIHPMEPEAVPPLPGFDVTEPTDHQFYWGGRIEGLPTHEHRSTVWPRLKHRYQRGGSEMISGPFGHGQ